ncbi:MAG TPA: glycosyltransferase family 4 protein [Patescibacteria group bacterium]|nr:glycosyltransferase family 4 protein [Patescibacteria group bacterium]
MKTVALYSPYIPKHAGGGEKYLLSIAEEASKSHKTMLLVSDSQSDQTKKRLREYEKIFGLNLSSVNVVGANVASLESRKYDVLFAMTDGSFFWSLAKKSYLIIQIPWTRKLSSVEKIKLRSWKNIIVYDKFVQNILRNSWQTSKIEVVEPYVDTSEFIPLAKQNIILNVGRFFSHSQSNSKRQDILIEAFKDLLKEKIGDWTLVLAGAVDPNPDSEQYLKSLREAAAGYPIEIRTDVTFEELKKLNGHATVYWHAAGYGVSESAHPENTEHFGITTLEAMAAGAVPFVVPKGGQREIVNAEEQFWNTKEELVAKTKKFISLSPIPIEQIQKRMRSNCELYSKDMFAKKIETLL